MDSEERIVRLAKPLKKGLLRLVFSRFCVIALLLVFQILVLIAVYGYFADKLPILISLGCSPLSWSSISLTAIWTSQPS